MTMTYPADVESLLKQLIAFDTRTRTPNGGLINFISGYLQAHDVFSQVFWSSDGKLGNLLATIGPANITGGIILSGHTDVVPADANQWDTNPFLADVRDGRIYGRGTADMKGFIASVLAAVPKLVAMPLVRPIHLVFTYDEEIDCIGMREFLATPEAKSLEPQAVILGEPTLMGLVVGHRGHKHFETVIRGRQSHGGNAWQGANSIAVATELIAHLYSLHPGTQGDDPASAALTTSINIGTIAGGEQFNIVAGHCRFDWEIRPALGVDDEGIVRGFEQRCREIEAFHADRGAAISIETTLLEAYQEFQSHPDSPAVALARSITGRNDLTVVGYGTEAPFYQELGLSVVIIGPGSIDQAHQPNEYVEISQLHACQAFIENLAERLVF